MTTTRSAQCDVLVVGAGVFGLWAAKRALEAGATVRVIEARSVGAGASGGVLGALTAHHPSGWNAKKAFQFDALVALPALLAALEAETGLSVGYRRVGRWMPIRNATFQAQIEARARDAATAWRTEAGGFPYERRAAADPDWLSPDAQPCGVVWDALAARIHPRAYLDALAAWVGARAAIEIGVAYRGWDGAARLSDGRRCAAGAVVLAAGWETFALLAEGGDARRYGDGVKGQAARVALPGVADRPLLYEDGVYVIPHDDGTVAIGSGPLSDLDAPDAPSPEAADFLTRARALCPPIAEAPIVEWWAGVRPRARRRDPMVGRLPGRAPIWVMSGGYKISFGVAHAIAAGLVDRMFEVDAPAPLPDVFMLAHHLGEDASSKGASQGASKGASKGASPGASR